jgi:two-component system, chemotaxis family, chemotaxis protein CheY
MPAASALKVLVVDDQLSMRSLIRNALQAIGVIDIWEAPDGTEGLVALGASPINLVITDFNMPKMDGLTFLRAIRTTPKTSKTAVIMLSGRSDKELVQRAVQFGANNYLVKPFTTQTLKEKLEAVFGPLT